MNFVHPEWLMLLIGIPPTIWILRIIERSRRESAERFGGSAAQQVDEGRGRPISWLTILAILCLLLAAAGPSIGFETAIGTRGGRDLVVVIDASRSMWVADGDASGRSRLEVAVAGIQSNLDEFIGARVGLISFAGEAKIVSPRTVDHRGLHSLLADVSPSEQHGGGSALGAGLALGLDVLEAATGRSRSILIVTDGENVKDEPSVDAAIERAIEEGIEVDTVRVGTERGGPIPESAKRDAGFVRSEDGEIAVSRADSTVLHRISERTGGRFLALDGTSVALLDLDLLCKARASSEGERSEISQVAADRFRWFIAPMIGMFLFARARSKYRFASHLPRVAAVLSLAFALPAFRVDPAKDVDALWRSALERHRSGDLNAAIEDYVRALAVRDDPRIRFDLAVARLVRGEWSLATIEFRRVTTTARHPEVLGAARFGEGVTAYRRAAAATTANERIEHLRHSRDAFIAAASDGVPNADLNLEHVTRELERAQRERANSGGAPNVGDSPRNVPPEQSEGPPPQGGSPEQPSESTTKPSEQAADGAQSPDFSPSESDPTRSGSRAGRSIEQIVREFENRRLAFDREQVVRSRAQEARDW